MSAHDPHPLQYTAYLTSHISQHPRQNIDSASKQLPLTMLSEFVLKTVPRTDHQ